MNIVPIKDRVPVTMFEFTVTDENFNQTHFQHRDFSWGTHYLLCFDEKYDPEDTEQFPVRCVNLKYTRLIEIKDVS